MITVISGTNRPNSQTKFIADYCYNFLINKGVECACLDLQDINADLLSSEMYQSHGQHPVISDIQDGILVPSDHWLVVSPEYNGSFPGILKLLIDALSIRRSKETFGGKKVSLIGVSSGRAGNFRGMEHLTGIFNYLNMLVMPNKLPVSSVDKHISKTGMISDETQKTLKHFMEEVVIFNNFPSV